MLLETITSFLGLVIGLICFMQGEVWGLIEGTYAGVVFVIVCYLIFRDTDDNAKRPYGFDSQTHHRIVLLMLKVSDTCYYLNYIHKKCVIP